MDDDLVRGASRSSASGLEEYCGAEEDHDYTSGATDPAAMDFTM